MKIGFLHMQKQRSDVQSPGLCFHYSDCTTPLLHKSEISRFRSSSVTVQARLCQTWSETQKTGYFSYCGSVTQSKCSYCMILLSKAFIPLKMPFPIPVACRKAFRALNLIIILSNTMASIKFTIIMQLQAISFMFRCNFTRFAI